MSINSKQQVKCPSCENLQEITVWSMITADDSPDLKEKLLKRDINIFKCDCCEQTALLTNPLLYRDEKKKLLISFTPCGKDEVLNLYNSIKETSKKSGELKKYEDYNLRFITSYDDLLEKILIFDNGFHDKVIEVIKVLILMQEPEKTEFRTALFGKTENENIEFLVKDSKEDMFYTSKVPIKTYDTIKEQLRQSGVKYKSFDWEIIDINHAASLLKGINNNLQ